MPNRKIPIAFLVNTFYIHFVGKAIESQNLERGHRMSERLLSVAEAAREKGVSRQAVHLAIKAGRIPAKKVWPRWMVLAHQEQFKAWAPRRARKQAF
jgi:hypothetical protein